MIRINLLAEGKKPVVTKKKQATEASRPSAATASST